MGEPTFDPKRTGTNHLMASAALFHRFGYKALIAEGAILGGAYLAFHRLNTSQGAREWCDLNGAAWLVDAFHQATGDDRVIAHRTLPPAQSPPPK